MRWKYIVEPDRPQMTILRMRIACWIIKARDTHSEYGIPWQKWLGESLSLLRYTYITSCIWFHSLSVWYGVAHWVQWLITGWGLISRKEFCVLYYSRPTVWLTHLPASEENVLLHTSKRTPLVIGLVNFQFIWTWWKLGQSGFYRK